MNHAQALVSACPYNVNRHPRTLSNTTAAAALLFLSGDVLFRKLQMKPHSQLQTARAVSVWRGTCCCEEVGQVLLLSFRGDSLILKWIAASTSSNDLDARALAILPPEYSRAEWCMLRVFCQLRQSGRAVPRRPLRFTPPLRAQDLCESRGGRPGLPCPQ